MSYEANSAWQTATPNVRPTPIPPPTHHYELAMAETSPSTSTTIGPFRVKSILPVELIDALKGPKRLTGVAAIEFLRACFGAGPMEKPGSASAFITARFVVSLRKEQYEFVIYKDRLVEDLTAKVLYYPRFNLRALLGTI
jgi:hypothetical protein